MKKTFIIISTIISMASCVTKDEIISNAETELKKHLLDARTYERIEAKIDTLYKSECLEIEADGHKSMVDMYKDFSKSHKDMADLLALSGSYNASEWYRTSKNHKDSQMAYQKRADDKLKLAVEIKGTPKDSIIQYNVLFRYYAVNRLGQRGINDASVTMNTDGTFKDKYIYK